MMMTRPTADEHAPYYAKYVALVPEQDVLTVLDDQAREVDSLLRSIPEDHASFSIRLTRGRSSRSSAT